MTQIFNFFKNDKWYEISAILAIIGVISFPFLGSLTLIFFAAIAIFHIERKSFFSRKTFFVFFYSFMLFMYILSIVNSPNIGRAWDLIVKDMPIFLIPFLLVLTNFNRKISFVKIKKSYLLGLTVSIFISLLIALYEFFDSESISVFFYYKLAEGIHLHPTYYSLYILTGFIVLFDHYKDELNFKILFLAGIFALMIFLLQSKIAYIFLVGILINLFVKARRKEKYCFGFVIAVMFILIFISYENNRLNRFFRQNVRLEIGSFEEDGVSQRIWLWENALRQIKEKPFFGYGLGSQKQLFPWKVEKELYYRNYETSVESASRNLSKLNLHNQYIQILYEFGIVGLILFILSIIIILVISIRRKNYLFLKSYLVFLGFLLTENLLDRQMGIYFYSFIMFGFFIKDNERVVLKSE